jgi:polysaccharide chain length determinant protein (PEP-CTERM system associated)
MPLRPNMEPGEFLDILRRRKWLILFSVLLIHFGTAVYCVRTPDLYKSTMKLLVIPPTVPEGVVHSNVNVGSVDRLMILRQEIFSRARLLAVINELGLFKESGTGAEEMVDMLRKRIKSDLGTNNTLTISFYHEDPKVAMTVASRLGSFFIDETIKSREATGQETSTFLASQLEETRIRLEQQEEKIKRYKLQFGGELPQQEQANLNRLQRLQEQIKNNSDAIARLQDRKVFMEAQISDIERIERNIVGSDNQDLWETIGSAERTSPQKLRSELVMRRKKLEELGKKYTPYYPSVVQARRELEQLEEKIALLRRSAKKSDEVSSGKAADGSSSQSMPDLQNTSWDSSELQRLRKQIAGIDLEIVALKRESANTVRTIDEIQRKVERLPQREQELITLMRGYENIKKSYEELMAKQFQSRISQKLEEKQKGEQFQIIEPAGLPAQPFKPDRLMVLGLALLASLGIGVGGSIGLEMMDPKLRSSRDFKSFFDLPVLACLPVIQDDRYKRRTAVRRAAVIGGLVSILGAYLVFLVVHGEKVRSILQSIGQSIGGGN